MGRGFKLRSKLAEVGNNGNGSGTAKLPNTLKLLPSTPQIKGLHIYVRNKDTSRDEFIFYSKRLIRLVIEYSLSLLPFEAVSVATPQGRGDDGASSERCVQGHPDRKDPHPDQLGVRR